MESAKWKIRNVYSGGNKGDMTSPDGLLLQIPEGSSIIVDNVYGGCRMADVTPKDEMVIPLLQLPSLKTILAMNCIFREAWRHEHVS